MAGVGEDGKGPGLGEARNGSPGCYLGRTIGLQSVCPLVLACEEDLAERCNGRLEQAGVL